MAVSALHPGRLRILRPLRVRDFALVWTGMTVSLLGDGIYMVAIAWQVYAISNTPTALAAVGVAWMVPQVLLLLVGGAISDRFERRLVLMLSDVLRGAAIAGIGALSVLGRLRLWEVLALVAVYGVGGAVFTPAFTGMVRDLVPRELLLEANSLGQLVRPFAVRFIGPAIGGVLIAVLGVGAAFLVDAGSFAFSATAFLLVRTRSLPSAGRARRSIARDIVDGITYVRSQTWLWSTLFAVTLSMLFFLGPVYVLMPFVVKNALHGGAQGLGLVFSAGGVGAIAASLLLGQRGLPRRPLVAVYLAWSATAFSLIGYSVATAVWQAMVVSFVSAAGLAAGGIAWTTLLQRAVPEGMIGRVSSLDWFLSFGLAPVSYALTGPAAHLLGARPALLGAGIVSGSVLVLVLLIVPAVRSVGAGEPAAPA